jgi:hypothetical protein
MPEVIVEGYTISYSTNVVTTPGLIHKTNPWAYFMKIGIRAPEHLILPAAPITFRVTGTIKGSPNVAPITLGFVQSVTKASRHAYYTNRHRFTRSFTRLPVKDGPGNIWYKEDAGALYTIDQQGTRIFARVRGLSFPFGIHTWDEPKFGFPDPVKVYSAIGAFISDEFITCVMARTHERNYFLHEYRWKFEGRWRPTFQPLGGITVTRDAPLFRLARPLQGRALAATRNRPVGLQLEGQSANDVEKNEFFRR